MSLFRDLKDSKSLDGSAKYTIELSGFDQLKKDFSDKLHEISHWSELQYLAGLINFYIRF